MNFQTGYISELCIHQQFEAQVAQAPEAIAVVAGRQRYTYRELNTQANQLARHLQKLGVAPETLVGICLERSPQMIVALLAILKAGGAYVPLDPSYPQERIELMLEDSQVPVVLTQEQYAESLPTETATVLCLDSAWSLIEAESPDNLDSLAQTNNLAYVIYTSGSTGKPKGVMIEQHSLANFVQAINRYYDILPSDRVLQFASISFDVAVEEIFTTLVQGATLILRSQDMVRSVQAFLQTCESLQLTVLNLPTAFWHKICVELPLLKFPESVRLVIIGSERAVPRWLEVWKECVSPQVRLINAYGPTEATVGSTICDLAGPDAIKIEGSRTLPIGKPIDNVQTYVLDADLKPVSVGVTGELYIAGRGLARGYLNRPDLTELRFIHISQENGNKIRAYRTGDLVRYRNDGHLEFLDRMDNQEKIRGFRIELSEIETILEQHSSVYQGLVLAREDRPGDKRLVAYIVPNRKPQTLTVFQRSSRRLVPTLRSYLQGKLPSYMVPSSFILLNEFPLTPNGKIDRRALPAPSAERPAIQEVFVAPRTQLESELAQLWSNILGIAEIGVNDNFFELGGDSLQTTEIISQVEDLYKVTIQLLDFFGLPTIAGLAALIQQVHLERQIPDEYKTLSQLQANVVLDSSVQAKASPAKISISPAAIFLTGGTGFVGTFLLSELLQRTQANIYCLVRAKTLIEAHQKIRSALEACHVGREAYYFRIIPVIGDLAQPRLGLTEEQFQTLAHSVDAIYHCGANVNLLYPYATLASTNVNGTHEVLKLASCGKPKSLHYLSTLDVFESMAATGARTFYEQDNIAQGPGIAGGYAQSKWVAEQMVIRAAERGLSVCIYRPGMVTGHSLTGYSNTTDVFCRLIKSLVQLRQAPSLELLIDMTPVDYVSRTIAHLSLQPQSLGKTFHVVNPQPLAFTQIVDALNDYGYGIQKVSYEQWNTALKAESNDLSSLIRLMSDTTEPDQRTCLECWLGGNDYFDSTNTLQGIQGQSTACPPADLKLLTTYLNYFTNSGFLEAVETVLASGRKAVA
jgi:amino acid adenylation domain-containing protein/thioester reductase-like protein